MALTHQHNPADFTARKTDANDARSSAAAAVVTLTAILNDASFTSAERDSYIRQIAQISRALVRLAARMT
jgi:hypothetical protein